MYDNVCIDGCCYKMLSQKTINELIESFVNILEIVDENAMWDTK